MQNFRINQSVLAALDAADAFDNVSKVTWSSLWRVPEVPTSERH